MKSQRWKNLILVNVALCNSSMSHGLLLQMTTTKWHRSPNDGFDFLGRGYAVIIRDK